MLAVQAMSSKCVCMFISFLSSPISLTGTDSSAMYWKSRFVHEEEEGGLVGGSADESTGQGGEGKKTGETHRVIQRSCEP